MTELEIQLLNAFEQLQTQHETQQNEFVMLYKDLVKRFEKSSEDNQRLKSSVSGLIEQVNSLTNQLQQLEKQYSENSR
jgi:seryl-tRNA synthetase